MIIQDEMALYLDDHFKLGRYLGPSIDVGLAITVNFLKESGGPWTKRQDG